MSETYRQAAVYVGEYLTEKNECVIELTPSKPAEKTDHSDELVLTPLASEEQPQSIDLTLDAESIAKMKAITFEGEEDAQSRFEEAMTAYDEAMDQAAGIK